MGVQCRNRCVGLLLLQCQWGRRWSRRLTFRPLCARFVLKRASISSLSLAEIPAQRWTDSRRSPITNRSSVDHLRGYSNTTAKPNGGRINDDNQLRGKPMAALGLNFGARPDAGSPCSRRPPGHLDAFGCPIGWLAFGDSGEGGGVASPAASARPAGRTICEQYFRAADTRGPPSGQPVSQPAG